MLICFLWKYDVRTCPKFSIYFFTWQIEGSLVQCVGNSSCSSLFMTTIDSESEHGVHIDEVVKRLKLPEEKIK